MGELRSAWTAEEADKHRDGSDESLPEASTVGRDAKAGETGGANHYPGEEGHEEAAADESYGGEALRVPPDPPLRPDAAAGDQV